MDEIHDEVKQNGFNRWYKIVCHRDRIYYVLIRGMNGGAYSGMSINNWLGLNKNFNVYYNIRIALPKQCKSLSAITSEKLKSVFFWFVTT